jgi:hypothetical protein
LALSLALLILGAAVATLIANLLGVPLPFLPR